MFTIPRMRSGALLAATLLTACGSSGEQRTISSFAVESPPLPALAMPGQDGRTTAPVAGAEATPQPTTPDQPGIAAGAPTDDEVAAELRQAFQQADGQSADPDRSIVDTATLTSGGVATVPPTAPRAVAVIINAANQVATRPYVYGGGHGRLADETFVDTAYDCSGSISFAFASAGLIDRPMVSGELAKYGRPGPGKWVTIYANDGHAWMTVGGLRFDTSGLRERGSRWQAQVRSTAGFTVRHPPGL